MGSERASPYDFAVLDAVWSGIVQSPAAMQRFLLADGLGSLLDLLDRGAAALQPLLLTIIAGMAYPHWTILLLVRVTIAVILECVLSGKARNCSCCCS